MPELPRVLAQPPPPNSPRARAAPQFGLAELGRSISQAAAVTATIYDTEQRTRARSLAAQAASEMTFFTAELENDPDYDTHEKRFQDKRQEVLERVGGEISAAPYRRLFDEAITPFADRAELGIRAEVRTRRIDATKAGLDVIGARYGEIAAAGDAAAGLAARDEVFGAIDEAAAAGAISQQEAVARREKWMADVRRALEERAFETGIQVETQRILGSGRSEREQLAATNEISDPRIAREVRARVKAKASAVRAEVKEARRESREGAWTVILDPTAPMDDKLTAILRWQSRGIVNASTARQMQEYLAGEKENPDPTRYLELQELSDADPPSFDEVDITAEVTGGRITLPQGDRLRGKQETDRAGKHERLADGDIGRAGRLYDSILGPAGSGEASKKKRSQFIVAFENAVAAEAGETGKALTPARKDEIANALLIEQEVDVPWSILDFEGRTFQIDEFDQVPEDVRKALERSYRKHKKTPSEAEKVRDALRLMIQQETAGP